VRTVEQVGSHRACLVSMRPLPFSMKFPFAQYWSQTAFEEI
jgi:hypothetical protein